MDTQIATKERQTNDKAALAFEIELAKLSRPAQRQIHATLIACLLLDTFEQWKRAEATTERN